MIAVVGSRSCTAAEEESAAKLGRALAARGFGVVSGMARGIDTAAMTGAVQGRGQVLAVLPTSRGEEVYPRTNRVLAQKVKLAGGLVLTPFNEPSQDGYTLRRRLIERNFLIALHCDIAIVVADTPHITGGTAWMVAFCQELHRPLYRLTSSGVLHLSLPQVKRKPWWKPELGELRAHVECMPAP